MSNFDFYRAKVAELRHRLKWMNDSLSGEGNDHKVIRDWIKDSYNKFERELATIDKLVQRAHPSYLSIIANKYIVLEKGLWDISLYSGALLREGPFERRLSNVIEKASRESEVRLDDFLITLGEGPAVSIGQRLNPLFHFRHESLGSAYSWVSVFHEVGHVAVRQRRQEVIRALVKVVKDHFFSERSSIGRVSQQRRQNIEQAINNAEHYWTGGVNYIRLEELFCDCFATFTTGLAYLYNWQDLGVRFYDFPRMIDPCDEHPPFSARYETCWHILPESLKQSESGTKIKQINSDYLDTASKKSNPYLQYGTVCKDILIKSLSETSANLINSFWPSLKQFDEEPLPEDLTNVTNESLSKVLNMIVGTMLNEQSAYEEREKKVIREITGC